jgi:hypothetical protein
LTFAGENGTDRSRAPRRLEDGVADRRRHDRRRRLAASPGDFVWVVDELESRHGGYPGTSESDNHVLRSALVAMLEWMRGYFFLG